MVQIEFILDKIFDWIMPVISGFGKHLFLIHYHINRRLLKLVLLVGYASPGLFMTNKVL